MNIIEYENYHETKSHVEPSFPYNTYLCSIPLDFTQVPTHWHDEFELILIKKGRGIIYVDLLPHPVSAGNIILIRPGQLHSISQLEQYTMEYENIIFQIQMLIPKHIDLCSQNYILPFSQNKYDTPTVIDSSFSYHQDLSNCIDSIDSLCSFKPPAYQLAVKGYLFQFFYILFTNNQGEFTLRKAKKSFDTLKQILKYIEINYSQHITIKTMADISNFSESYFMKYFKKHMGMSFTQYLNNYRLTMASRLLVTSTNSIIEIASITGFENLSYFNRLFKKKYNVIPREYRKLHQ
ncbi:AraC family transcriptional regulator [Anaerosacchariphilus polymeriproducens]|uniref:AraC family transcriptional regulator n=1 Tax=Anaerosacchariphilus polymeriproducens TaxID=1812858 RepID=A0A371AS62_9FIRM|nr:AraC family transcriptional regulator [Anaerosacchariphilus polymeriproducens]RDU22395.1 AraC family transcriptional regulator [Anaerosacchariphilus polymeriproducens]